MRMRAALDEGEALASLERVVIDLKGRGLSKEAAYEWLNELREMVRKEGDQLREDVVLDVMDFVYGFCTPDKRIWP